MTNGCITDMKKMQKNQEHALKTYCTQLRNLKRNGNVFDTFSLQKQIQDQINNENKPITPSEIEAIIKNLTTKNKHGQVDLGLNSMRLSKDNWHQYSSN